MTAAKGIENYGLSITVAVGISLLVLNLCVYIGMLRLVGGFTFIN